MIVSLLLRIRIDGADGDNIFRPLAGSDDRFVCIHASEVVGFRCGVVMVRALDRWRAADVLLAVDAAAIAGSVSGTVRIVVRVLSGFGRKSIGAVRKLGGADRVGIRIVGAIDGSHRINNTAAKLISCSSGSIRLSRSRVPVKTCRTIVAVRLGCGIGSVGRWILCARTLLCRWILSVGRGRD